MTVLLCHSVPAALGPNKYPYFINALGIPVHQMAVDVFFVISGYLITASLYSRKDLANFAIARIRRLVPGLLVSIFFTFALVYVFFDSLPLSKTLTDKATLKYLFVNGFPLLKAETYLPGAFPHNPVPGLVNPSLWTLSLEVRMYIVLAALWFVIKAVKKYDLKHIVLLVFVASGVLESITHFVPWTSNQTILFMLRFMPVFFGGATLQQWKRSIPLKTSYAAMAFVPLLVAFWDIRPFYVIYLFALPYLVIYLAYVPKGPLRAFNRVGDYSYGIYIYAFPIQQAIAAVAGSISVIAMMGIATVATLAFAVPSWHFIEKPLLTPSAPKPTT